MTPDEYLAGTGARLAHLGYDVKWVQLPRGPALVGSLSQFRLRWMATKLNLFVVVIAVPHVSRPVLDLFSTDALDYGVRMKGQLRGFQSGVAVMPALIAYSADPDAIATLRPVKKFAAFTFPAIVDFQSGQTHSFDKTMMLGGIYAPWLRKRLQDAFPALPAA